jgi:predicted acylesterase/phospholipase RssA
VAPRVEVADVPAAPRARALGGESLLPLLPDRVRTELLDAAEPMTLAAGGWLFEAGGPADALYVLLAGRLDVIADGSVLREIVPEEVVGELAVLAGATRSAGVRARRDSRLLRIPAAGFRGALEDDVDARRAVTTALATQLQRSRGLDDAAPAAPRIISVLGLSPQAPTDEVATLLVEALGRHLKVVAPGRVAPDGLDQAERESERVVLVASPLDDADWRAFCLRQADRVVIVADAAAPPAELAPAQPSYLLLVGDPPTRANLVDWHDAVGPRHIYAARASGADVAETVSALAARLAGRSLGVALAGGGARAFAAIGVLEELEANSVRVDRISGCSVGGVVAALFATGHTADSVDAICYDEFVRRSPFRDYTIPRVSISRGRKAEAALHRQFGDLHFEELPRQLALVSTDMLNHSAVVHRRGLVREALRASLSLPGLFPPARLTESLHIDGGVLDNLPVRSLAEDEGPILAVNIASVGGLSSRSGPPRMPSLPETMLRAMLMGSATAIAAARDQATVIVTPDTRGIGLFEFHQIDRAVQAGRAAGRAALDALAALPL